MVRPAATIAVASILSSDGKAIVELKILHLALFHPKMLKKAIATVGLAGMLLAAVSCTPEVPSASTTPVPSPSPAATGTTIVLGDIADEPVKKIKRFQPLADYLSANLGEFGIGTGEVKIAPDIETMVQWMKSGEVDLYFDSPYPAAIVSDRAGAEPLLRRWKDGVAKYHTVFFARADSGIASLQDLQGKILGLEEKFSTSGYLMPMAFLIDSGLNPVEKEAANAAVAKDEVGYTFTRDDENTIQWVVSGKIIAGALDNQTFAEIPEETRSQLTILAETEPIARQVVLVAADVSPEEQEAIKALLVNLDETEEGRKILTTFKNTDRFDEFESEASLLQMQQLYEKVQDR